MTNPGVKIPRGWRELRNNTRIRNTDRYLRFNGPRFVPVSENSINMEGQHYIKHQPGGHWTVIRRIPKR